MGLLVNVPCLNLPGGVANHYKGLRYYFSEDVQYNFVGRRYGVPGAIMLPYDLMRFFVLCIFRRYDALLFNPSLGKTALIRDALFLSLGKMFRMKVFVFFHGWDPRVETRVDENPRVFKRLYKRADGFFVLANEFAEKLRHWGITAPIFLTSTKVDDRLVDDFDVNNKSYGKTILFLARVEEEKGIFTALKAFSHVVSRSPEVRLIVAGSGGALGSAKEFVRKRAIPNIEFLGNVSGETLKETFRRSDIYILPTTHGEGMPTSLLEAMAFGLPVITRPVGGIKDFFEDGKMGFLSESVDAKWYSYRLSELLSNVNLMKQIGYYNHSYAKKRFLASQVAPKLESILRS